MFCNDAYLSWAERPLEALLGRDLNEFYGPASWAAAQPAFERAFAGGNVTYERPLQHGSSAGRWARMQLFPDVDAAGAVEAVFTITFDIHDDGMAR